jgi:CubicO group peptidase (beta-lactamase class C family)
MKCHSCALFCSINIVTMKRILWLLSANLCLSTMVHAQTRPQQLVPATNVATAGFSADRLKRIDTYFQEMVDKGMAPNAVTFIAHHGKIVHYKAYGYRNLEQKVLAQKDDIYRIASQTKLITTIALLMLYEEGKFSLDDPLSRYLPAFSNAKVLVSYDREKGTYETKPANTQITIRQLLSHTTGIPYQHPLDTLLFGKEIVGLGQLDNVKLDAYVDMIAKRPLLHEPGEKFTYGFNTDVAGKLVEVFSGMSLKDYFEQKIFVPMGMKDTYFYLPSAKVNRLVELYSLPGTNSQLKVSDSEIARKAAISGAQTLYLGGAGLVSTVENYARICQLILNGGEFNGVRLLSRKTVELMARNQIGALTIWDRQDKFGLGLQIFTENSRYGDQASAGSLSWGGAYCSEYTIDPKEDLIMLVFTNVLPYTYASDFIHKFRVLAYQALQ